MKNKLTQKRLKEVLQYYPITGNFRWIKSAGYDISIGSIAGTRHSRGYIQIYIDKISYQVHRLAFLYMTGKFPELQVDHEDHNRSNNKWLNLKEATNQENSKNRLMSKLNKSGYTGVSWYKITSRWVSFIRFNGKTITLGYFIDKKDAIRVRKKAEKKYGYHPNHGKRKRAVLIGI